MIRSLLDFSLFFAIQLRLIPCSIVTQLSFNIMSNHKESYLKAKEYPEIFFIEGTFESH